MVILPQNLIINKMNNFTESERRGRTLLNSLLEQLGFTDIEETADAYDRIDCYA